LHLLFQEKEPEKGWQRLDELGVLKPIHPALRNSAWLQAKFRELRERWGSWQATHPKEPPAGVASTSPESHDGPVPALLYWGLVAFQMSSADLEGLIRRLKPPRRDARCLREVHRLREALAELSISGLLPSRIYHLLKDYSEEALLIAQVASDDPLASQNIERYQKRLRWVKPHLDGEYLKELGLKPGPIYKRILTQVHDAVLDNRVRTRAEEEALVKELVRKAS